MLRLFCLLFFFHLTIFYAQVELSFNKKFVQSEDKWIAFQTDTINRYAFGFAFIDVKEGLMFDYEGTFKIDSLGKYIPRKKEEKKSVRLRLKPGNEKIAFIPDDKLIELQVAKIPEWLKEYKKDEGSIERLYSIGYLYNGWNECEKALEYLDKAKAINPDYLGLGVELAYSYNCLKRYEDAVEVLKNVLIKYPFDDYSNKELIYAYAKLGDLDEAEKRCRFVFKNCKDTYNAENAYNILQGYYFKKDKKRFMNWLKESKAYFNKENQFTNLIEKMKDELK
ncbi:conserved hypothetical protein [Flavobacterium sp. 9AF]|uniref:tetratricopeptide repeat protein n=1 Tax=Flavobacterium sp. 9AF TaxID=2653142 RepID=UPI0012F17F77|nr:hypothetical protein [Flavobacterium sp. 9AF]VXC33023.1 conserved hypothetical protein [Flavobacterium sp. 9AF]